MFFVPPKAINYQLPFNDTFKITFTHLLYCLLLHKDHIFLLKIMHVILTHTSTEKNLIPKHIFIKEIML